MLTDEFRDVVSLACVHSSQEFINCRVIQKCLSRSVLSYSFFELAKFKAVWQSET